MLTLLLALCAAGPPKPDEGLVLAPARPSAERSLKYELTVDDLDLLPGNAAAYWIRAGMAARRVNYKWSNEEWEQMAGPLDKMPRQHFKGVVAKHADALALADQAARRARCDWDRPPVTVQSVADGSSLMLDEIQTLREIANLIKLRCRVELAERDFDRAIVSLRTGLALARHTGESDLLIQDLVAIAIAQIMFNQVQEWACTPGSPSLYWPLTALPQPLITVRGSIRYELNTIYRSFPALREFRSRRLTEGEASTVMDKVFGAFNGMAGGGPPGDWLKPVSSKLLVAARLDAAKKGLREAGRTDAELAGMPAAQVVALYYLDTYDRTRDDVVRLLGLPAHEGIPLLMDLERIVRARAKEDGNPLIALLMPAIVKVRYAEARLELTAVSLRAAEALRAGMKDPGMRHPFTGQRSADWLHPEKGRTVLRVPAPPLEAPNGGRLFTLPAR
ncbi:MAG: hypothetical protein ACRC33_22410 [Gemmataceae bacterium]